MNLTKITVGLLVFAMSHCACLAQDVVGIVDESLYIGAQKPGESLSGIVNAQNPLEGVVGEVTFFKTETGRLDGNEELEVITTMKLELTTNSIGSKVYAPVNKSGKKLNSDTLVGALLKLTREGYRDYYSQVIRLSAYGGDSKKCLVYNRNNFNQSGFVTDANILLAQESRRDVASKYVPKAFEPRYMQIHLLFPMHIKMQPIDHSKMSSTDRFSVLHTPDKK